VAHGRAGLVAGNAVGPAYGLIRFCRKAAAAAAHYHHHPPTRPPTDDEQPDRLQLAHAHAGRQQGQCGKQEGVRTTAGRAGGVAGPGVHAVHMSCIIRQAGRFCGVPLAQGPCPTPSVSASSAAASSAAAGASAAAAACLRGTLQ
jgi:hypothetical protein